MRQGVATPPVAADDLDQLIWALHGQRTPQNRARQTEDGGVRADSQRQAQHRRHGKASRLSQHPRAKTQVLKHLVLQSFWLQPERIPEGARTTPQQIELSMPVETIPFRQHLFTMTQLRFPLLPPVGAQAAQHDHADRANQPEPETKTS